MSSARVEMMRAGRKRKMGERFPCGKLREPMDEDKLGKQVRARRLGVKPEDAGDARLGTAYGRLCVFGYLHPDPGRAEQMRDVCERVARIHAAYAKAIDQRRVAAAKFEPTIKGHDETDTSEADIEAMRRWRDIENRLEDYPLCFRALRQLVVEDVEVEGYDLVNACLAINSLARMWKVF